jgi:hypothetical protein
MSTLVVTMTLDPERLEQVRRHFENDVAPWATAQPGFESGEWLVSRDARRGLGVIRFESPETAEKAAVGPRNYGADPTLAWSIDAVDVFDRVMEASVVGAEVG